MFIYISSRMLIDWVPSFAQFCMSGMIIGMSGLCASKVNDLYIKPITAAAGKMSCLWLKWVYIQPKIREEHHGGWWRFMEIRQSCCVPGQFQVFGIPKKPSQSFVIFVSGYPKLPSLTVTLTHPFLYFKSCQEIFEIGSMMFVSLCKALRS